MALFVRYMYTAAVLHCGNFPVALFVHTILPAGVTTMSNSRSYPVTPVASQPYGSTLVALSYSSHHRAVILLLSTTLGLFPVHSLPHLTINPAWS